MLCETCSEFAPVCGSIRILGNCYAINPNGLPINRLAKIIKCCDYKEKENVNDNRRIKQFKN